MIVCLTSVLLRVQACWSIDRGLEPRSPQWLVKEESLPTGATSCRKCTKSWSSAVMHEILGNHWSWITRWGWCVCLLWNGSLWTGARRVRVALTKPGLVLAACMGGLKWCHSIAPADLERSGDRSLWQERSSLSLCKSTRRWPEAEV